jgi:hypothetical protein
MNTITRKKLLEKITDIPDSFINELFEYVNYLKFKKEHLSDKNLTAIASEKVLAKDWLQPKEDEEWKDL